MQDGDTFTNTDLSNRNNYSDLEGHSHIAILFKWEFVRNTMRVTQRVARFSRQQPNLLLLGLHIYKILLFFSGQNIQVRRCVVVVVVAVIGIDDIHVFCRIAMLLRRFW